MTVTVFEPKVSVTLFKLIQRTQANDGVASRYEGSERQLDLTPFLGEGGAVRTVRNLTAAAGGFSITFPDQFDQQSGDTLYALIEPMDMVEIRAARHPDQYAGQPYPLVMRGFVSRIQRVETMNDDGTPNRLVVIQGQDFGKLWQIHQILLPFAIATEEPVVDTFGLLASAGIQPILYGLSAFMTALTNQVMNKKIADLSAFSSRQIQPFQVSATVPEGQVNPPLYSNWQGPVWGLVEQFGERPWNEAFFDYDANENPLFVFRPAPLKDMNGNLIMPGATDPGTFDIDISAVVSLDVGRSDERIANLYYCPPGVSMPDTNMGVNLAAMMSQGGASMADLNYLNDSPTLYGERMLVIESRVVPTAWTQLPSITPVGQRNAGIVQANQWNVQRSVELKELNRDNGVWESGQAIVRGDETLRPGRYLQLTRGDLVSSYYMVQVAQTFIPFQSWTTALTLERGTGFLNRIKYQGSPYWAEGRSGPYSITSTPT